MSSKKKEKKNKKAINSILKPLSLLYRCSCDYTCSCDFSQCQFVIGSSVYEEAKFDW